MPAALIGEVDPAVLELHEQPDAVDVAEADSEPGAKQPTYRVACPATGDYMEYEPFQPTPLTSLKQARLRLARADLGGCASGHYIEKKNALGLWERYVGKKVGGVKVSERGLEITIPANPLAPPPRRRDDGVELTVSDFFAGCGGSSTGYEQVPGLNVVMAVNHWDLAISSHQHNVPGADHDRADISKVDPRRYPRTQIAHFSPECFPAGTLIVAKRGLVPIEEIVVGDEVWTHQLRWQPVTETMTKVADTIVLDGYGHTSLETTSEHPFYIRESRKPYTTRKGCKPGDKPQQVRRTFAEPQWKTAGNLSASTGDYWATPLTFGARAVPEIGGRGLDLGAEFWWMVGRWLGDGCLARSRCETQITCSRAEADELARRLEKVAPKRGERAGARELHWTRRDIRTATVFTTIHEGLADWLYENFGEHAAGKTIPTWALAMPVPWREALLDGYASADGHLANRPGQRPVMQITTVSKALAIGVRMLATTLGHKVGISLHAKRTEGVIEGRTVKMRPVWVINWTPNPSPNHDHTYVADGIRWTPIRQTKPGRERVQVYNFSVAEDESYIADGIVVHNCTNWSQAKGKKVDFDTEFKQLTTDNLYDPDGNELDPEAPESEDAKWRSRMLMTDVVRMTMHHEYEAIIVENVTDILAWWALKDWIKTICNIGEGYNFKVVVLNSAFANQMGHGAPQLRDRVYFLFWKKKYRRPNFGKWLRPKCWCTHCLEVVEGIYSPLPGKPRAMRHGQQYHYTCPNAKCKRIVQPFALPAKAAIDPTLPAQRIADRKNPLKPNTYNRVDAGLERWGPYLLAGIAGHTFERRPGVRTWPIGQPAPSQTATNTLGLVQPVGGSWNTDAHPTDVPLRSQTTRESQALVVPVEGRDGVSARPDGEPMRAQTARHQDAVVQAEIPGLVVPLRKGAAARPDSQAPLTTVTTGDQQALVVPLRNNGVAAPADRAAFPTFAAAGTHHALVMRNNNSRGEQSSMTTPDAEPIRALTTAGHQSVIQPAIDGLFSYDTGHIRHPSEPLPAQTTIAGDALLRALVSDLPRLRPEDCTLRMLAVDEIRGGMAFPSWFRLLGRAKRDLVKQLGNAVTPNVTAVLGALMFEAITGVELERFEYDPFAPLN